MKNKIEGYDRKREWKKVKRFLFIDDMTIWWKQPKKSTKKLLEVDLEK